MLTCIAEKVPAPFLNNTARYLNMYTYTKWFNKGLPPDGTRGMCFRSGMRRSCCTWRIYRNRPPPQGKEGKRQVHAGRWLAKSESNFAHFNTLLFFQVSVGAGGKREKCTFNADPAKFSLLGGRKVVAFQLSWLIVCAVYYIGFNDSRHIRCYLQNVQLGENIENEIQEVSAWKVWVK